MKKFAIAVHGGAGTILRSSMTADKEILYKKGLREAIHAGEQILREDGSSLNAVEAAIKKLEDNPLFNAGKGSVFTHEGIHEMDASVMRGDNLAAGAVSGIQHIKNPIQLARRVMEKSEHVLLSGNGALNFARTQGFEELPDSYFFEQMRFDQLQQALKSDTVVLDHTQAKDKKFGTVGAVALDRFGNLAAGTSTGGMTNKKNGRVGDTPIIGAGTYANNNTCAISCTGHGEYFMRAVVAYDISCLMEYRGLSLKDACKIVVQEKLVALGGEGGLVALDAAGNIELPFNSEGMYRASLKESEKIFVGIYKN